MSVRATRRTTLVVSARAAEGFSMAELARAVGADPRVARRLAALGLFDPLIAGRDLWPRAAAVRLARALRLRRDLGLNLAGAVLVSELLDRIDELERRRHPDQET
jgi:MerR HTH family regulatory protein